MNFESMAAHEAKEQGQVAEVMLNQAQAYVIANNEQAAYCADKLGEIKKKMKDLEASRVEITKPIDDAKKRVMDLFRSPADYLAKAESAYKSAISAWQTQERQRIEALRIEQQKVADRLAEDARREAAAAAAELAQAQTLGDDEAIHQAQTIANAARVNAEIVAHLAPVVIEAPVKLAGVSSRETWSFEITNEQLIPRDFLMVDDKKLSAYVKAFKAQTNVAGVRAYAEQTISARASK